jgi:arginine decarboxylase
MIEPTARDWSVADASELYEIARWGKGYFSVGQNGHVQVHPERNPARSIDLKELVDQLRMRDLQSPVLIRFNGILKDRLREIHDVFTRAIAEHGYRGEYACVYPIKVNQQRYVVEGIIKYGRPYRFGLEAGSKPELLAVVAMTDPSVPVVCNGFKDAGFIEMALLAQKIGRRVIPIVEKYTELELILRTAERLGIKPWLGMRIKLASRGSGRWHASGGYRSKFGLTTSEMLQGVNQLKACGLADSFKLLHFHLGSQITNIRHVKAALVEAARVYVDLIRRGVALEYLDVGGGLGVDYDGSQTNFESSMNYTLEEYANDVIYYILTVCDDAGVPHPNIISESGRAVAAYHSVLVFDVLGVSGQGSVEDAPQEIAEDAEQPLHDLLLTYRELTVRNLLESYHDALQARDMTMNLFSTGYLPLDQRAIAEHIFFAICHKIRRLMVQLDETPEDLQDLDRMLADTYFCNFSLFQSMPDSWAVKQLFPVMPIHRLDQRPTRHAVLGDITCDSDGKIDQFIDRRDVRRSLLLHTFNGKSYYLGAFLVGAYQEILGDLHNLFGDTNVVHVNLTENGQVELETIIKGDTVCEVLDYVEFNGRDLIQRLQTAVDVAVREGRIDHQEAGRFVKFYEDGLNGYTYLEDV